MKRSYTAFDKSNILKYIAAHVRSLSEHVFYGDSSGVYTCYKCGYTSDRIGVDLDVEYRKTVDNFDDSQDLFGSFISKENVINLCVPCSIKYKGGMWEIYNANGDININNISINASGIIS